MPCPIGYPVRSPSVGHTGRATRLPAIRYVPAVTYVWKENIWRSVIDADRSLPGIGSRNGRAVYFLALCGEIRLWKEKMAKKERVILSYQ